MIELEIQRVLKKKGFYDGEVDGKIGPSTYDALALLVQSLGMSSKGWSKARLKIAGEQYIYREAKLPIREVDGLEGHVTRDARDAWKARLTLTYRSHVEELAKEQIIQPIPVKTSGKVTPMRTWPRQKDCTKYYGPPGESRQDVCILPFEMTIAWDPKDKIKKFGCHELVKKPLERLFQRTFDHYGYEKIKELRLHLYGGCYNKRKMRGGSSWSQHSWGIAVDLDPDNNQLKWGRNKATFAKPAYNKFWEFVYDEGAISLGKERNYDWMHFQFSRL